MQITRNAIVASGALTLVLMGFQNCALDGPPDQSTATKSQSSTGNSTPQPASTPGPQPAPEPTTSPMPAPAPSPAPAPAPSPAASAVTIYRYVVANAYGGLSFYWSTSAADGTAAAYGLHLEGAVFKLLPANAGGNVPIYQCGGPSLALSGGSAQLSTSSLCPGSSSDRAAGGGTSGTLIGFAMATATPSVTTTPLYLCNSTNFMTTNPNECATIFGTAGSVVGYVP